MSDELRHKLLTEPETAVRIDVSLWTMIKWRKQGRIKALRLGHRTIRYRAEDVEAFLKKSATKAK